MGSSLSSELKADVKSLSKECKASMLDYSGGYGARYERLLVLQNECMHIKEKVRTSKKYVGIIDDEMIWLRCHMNACLHFFQRQQ